MKIDVTDVKKTVENAKMKISVQNAQLDIIWKMEIASIAFKIVRSVLVVVFVQNVLQAWFQFVEIVWNALKDVEYVNQLILLSAIPALKDTTTIMPQTHALAVQLVARHAHSMNALYVLEAIISPMECAISTASILVQNVLMGNLKNVPPAIMGSITMKLNRLALVILYVQSQKTVSVP